MNTEKEIKIRKVTNETEGIGKPSALEYSPAVLEILDLETNDVVSASNDLPWDEE